jgi:S-DNA-T family DNA segregation ATPase FtsK/SpoIIIE
VLALLEAAPSTLVVDDLDQLTRLVPQAGDTLDALVESGSAVLASASLDAVLGAYRGTLASLRSRRTGLVLSPLSPGSGEVFGTPLDWDADPVHPRHPGRGVVQAGARTTPVQVFAPG